MASWNDTDGVLLGYMLYPDNVLTKGLTLGCKCKSNSGVNNFPERGCANSVYKLIDGFAVKKQYFDIGPRLPLNKAYNGHPAVIPPLTFHGHDCISTQDSKLIIVVHGQQLPQSAQDNSFTTTFCKGWSRMPIDGSDDMREQLRVMIQEAGLTWDPNNFGVFVVRSKC